MIRFFIEREGYIFEIEKYKGTLYNKDYPIDKAFVCSKQIVAWLMNNNNFSYNMYTVYTTDGYRFNRGDYKQVWYEEWDD